MSLPALLQHHAPYLGVNDPSVDWTPYVRELSRFDPRAVEWAMDEWRDGNFDPKNPLLATIFPQPWQLAALAMRWEPPSTVQALGPLPTLPDSLAVRLTPAEVAAKLRAQPPPLADDEVIL